MYIMDYFWHKDLDRIPHITGSFIEAFASANLPIKATQTRGYKVCLCFVKKDRPILPWMYRYAALFPLVN